MNISCIIDPEKVYIKPLMTDKTKGLISAFSSVIVISASSILAKILMTNVPPIVVIYMRFFTGFIFIMLFVFLGIFKVKFDNIPLHIVRGITGSYAVMCFFMVIHYSGIAKGTVLTYTYTLFSVPAAYFLLGDKPAPDKIFILLFSFFGIVVLINPELKNLNYYDLLGLSGAMSAGFTTAIIRKLRRTNNAETVVMSQTIGGMVLLTVPFSINYSFSHNEYIILIIVVGVLAIIGRILSNHSLKYLPPVEYGPIALLTVVFGFLSGLLFFKETFQINHITGSVIIIVSILYISVDPVRLLKKSLASKGKGPKA